MSRNLVFYYIDLSLFYVLLDHKALLNIIIYIYICLAQTKSHLKKSYPYHYPDLIAIHICIVFVCFSLQTVLRIEILDDIIDPQYLSGKHIMHNCLHINKSGVVTNINPKGNELVTTVSILTRVV